VNLGLWVVTVMVACAILGIAVNRFYARRTGGEKPDSTTENEAGTELHPVGRKSA